MVMFIPSTYVVSLKLPLSPGVGSSLPYIFLTENANPKLELFTSSGFQVDPHKSEVPPYVTVVSLVTQQSPIIDIGQGVSPVSGIADGLVSVFIAPPFIKCILASLIDIASVFRSTFATIPVMVALLGT